MSGENVREVRTKWNIIYAELIILGEQEWEQRCNAYKTNLRRYYILQNKVVRENVRQRSNNKNYLLVLPSENHEKNVSESEELQ